jgi:hypothetical protein
MISNKNSMDLRIEIEKLNKQGGIAINVEMVGLGFSCIPVHVLNNTSASHPYFLFIFIFITVILLFLFGFHAQQHALK